MKRQNAAGNKSTNSQKNSQVLNKGFAIFQRNQQQEQEPKSRTSILIRTLPFIKRKHTEDYTPNYGGIGNSEDLKTPKEVDDNKDQAQQQQQQQQQLQFKPDVLPLLNDGLGISPRMTGYTSKDSRNLSRQSIRLYVHNVGQNFGKGNTNYHKQSQSVKNFGGNKGGNRLSQDSIQQQTINNLGFLTYSQFQSPSQTPLATAYYSTNADRFSMHHPKNVTKQQHFDNNSDQSPDSLDNSQNFTETQKQFFENFMQESKPIHPNDMPVLSDNQIKEDYTFKFQTDITKLENPQSSISFLNGFPHNFPLIESHYYAALRFKDEYNQLKDVLRKEMEIMKQKYEKEVDDLKDQANLTKLNIEVQIQEDFVQHQTEQFALNKEITKLQRDKMQMELDIESQMRRVRQMEEKLYGQEIFNIEPQDPYILNMTTQNLRSDTNTPISSKMYTHNIKNIIH